MADSQQQKQAKKKRFRFFDTYIGNLLKEINSEKGITANTRQQLNSVLKYVTEILANKSRDITIKTSKRTVSDAEVLTATRLSFEGEFLEDMETKIQESLDKYSDSEKTGSKQNRAGLVFPPSVVEKYLRNFGTSKLMVTQRAPVALAVVVQNIASHILSSACEKSDEAKKVRLQVRNLELAVRDIPDLDQFFKVHNIQFVGGGVTPFIHPNLQRKTRRKRKTNTDDDSSGKKPHRYKPGTVALRNIKKMQKTHGCLVLAKSPFEKVVRSSFETHSNGDTNSKVAKSVFITIQYYIESKIVQLLEQATLSAIHGGRVKVLPEDIDFILAIREGRVPLSLGNAVGSTDEAVEDDGESFDPLLEGLTKPSLQRLARQAGVKTMSGDCINVIRRFVVKDLDKICRDTMIMNSVRSTKTIMVEDVHNALTEQGERVARSEQLGSKTCAAN